MISRKLLAIGVATLALSAAGCSGHISGVLDKTPQTFQVRGSVSVTKYQLPDFDPNIGVEDGDSCVSDDGYDDITSGAQVIISDASGTQIAVGNLGSGWVAGDACKFDFSITDVPDGQKLYQIHVGNENRGNVTYKRDDLNNDVAIGF